MEGRDDDTSWDIGACEGKGGYDDVELGGRGNITFDPDSTESPVGGSGAYTMPDLRAKFFSLARRF